MLTVLSSYLLDDEGNARIQDAVARAGGRYIPAPRDRDERIALLDERIGEATVLLGGRLEPAQWEAARALRWIHVPWAGVNNLLTLDGLAARVVVTNSSGVMSDSVADQTMAYLLLIARDMVRQIRAQPRGEWLPYTLENTPRRRLHGATLGLVGYGAIGRAIAHRARAFGMRVVAMRRHADATEGEQAPDRTYGPQGLHAMLHEADYVVIAAPLNDRTRGMIAAPQFAAMRPSAWIVNIARGAIVVERDLVEALERGTIAGAALDVFEREPLPADSPLWHMENVILTPHSSGGFRGFWDAVVDLFLDNLDRYLRGAPLRNLVDLRRGY